MPDPDTVVLSHPKELAASEIFNEAVLDQLPMGVVVLDHDGYVVKYNAFEERLARRERRQVIGRSFFRDVAVCTDVPAVRGTFESKIGDNSLSEDIEFAFELPFLPRPREVRLYLRSFALGPSHFGVLIVEDLSAQKELERERDRMLSILVHDLRNPLQGILGYTDLLRQGVFGDLQEGKQKEALATIEQSSQRMSSLLEGTLEELSGENRAKRPVNLHALVLSSIGNLLPAARQHDVELWYANHLFTRAEFPQRTVTVHGVVESLASMVQNLLSNAIKYATSRVQVDLDEAGNEVILEVRDDGRGIAPADQEKIFQRGTQTAESLPGHGIGLFSVRRAVERHAGRVELESEPGAGALFRVRLPAP